VMVAALEGTGADESDGMPFDPLATTYHAAYQPGPLHRYQDPYVSPPPPTHTHRPAFMPFARARPMPLNKVGEGRPQGSRCIPGRRGACGRRRTAERSLCAAAPRRL
jgi:hypothetical protein